MKLRQLRKAIAFLAILLTSGAIFFYLYFRAALSQEPDTPDVVKAALEMEWTHTNSNPINSNPNRLLIRAGSSGLETHLEGWTQVDRLGALHVYRRGTQRLNASCGMFSRRYLICNLHPRP